MCFTKQYNILKIRNRKIIFVPKFVLYHSVGKLGIGKGMNVCTIWSQEKNYKCYSQRTGTQDRSQKK